MNRHMAKRQRRTMDEDIRSDVRSGAGAGDPPSPPPPPLVASMQRRDLHSIGRSMISEMAWNLQVWEAAALRRVCRSWRMELSNADWEWRFDMACFIATGHRADDWARTLTAAEEEDDGPRQRIRHGIVSVIAAGVPSLDRRLTLSKSGRYRSTNKWIFSCLGSRRWSTL